MQPNLPTPTIPVVSTQQSFFQQKGLYILILTIIILALIIGLIFLFRQNKSSNLKQSSTVSPDILDLTAPVKSLYGTVEKIEGNTLTVTRQVVAPSKALTYKVTTGLKTIFSRPPSAPIPYLFKVASISGMISQPTIKDIKEGDLVSVFTNSDLRLLSKKEFEATSVELAPKINNISGTIIGIKGDTLIVKATGTKEINYEVKVLADIEVSYASRSADINLPLTSKKLSLTELKSNMVVTVYTDSDLNKNTQIRALRIEPIFSTLAPGAP